jgi:hypothetical protein
MPKEPEAFALICWLLWSGLAVIASLDVKLSPLAIAMAASIYVLWRLYHRRVARAAREKRDVLATETDPITIVAD